MYTPIKRRAECSARNEMASSPQTPEISLSFSRELRKVLQERNLLTAKTRQRVCSMLTENDRSPNQTPNSEMNKRLNFRLQAIEEIVTSERSYLRQLQILIEYFVKPLRQHHHLISEINHATLFGQIEMIYNLNSEFLKELESDMNMNVAKAFLKMAPFFKLYSVYAFDYRHSLLILQELLSKNVEFRKFIECNETRPEVQCKLNSLMIVPIQRVPRYKLLLEQVMLYTSPADDDFKLLKESVKQIENTVAHINSCIEDQEITQVLINLQNALVNRTPNIIKPSRKIIREGILEKVTRHGETIRRYCALMSDIFMYCKILKEHRSSNNRALLENSLECCCIFPLKKSKVYNLLPGTFKITCQGDGIIFKCDDLQTCQYWVNSIRDAIDLHIQCYKTLRKESSKRTPLRKSKLKKFGDDYILSPKHKKSEFDGVFRNKNHQTDDENDTATSKLCFKRKWKTATSKSETSSKLSSLALIKKGLNDDHLLTCPKVDKEDNITNNIDVNAAAVLKNYTQQTIGINALMPKYYTTNILNKFDTVSQSKGDHLMPTQKKRVKFDDDSNTVHEVDSKKKFNVRNDIRAHSFNQNYLESKSLKDKIYDFFANLF